MGFEQSAKMKKIKKLSRMGFEQSAKMKKLKKLSRMGFEKHAERGEERLKLPPETARPQ